MTGVRKSYSKLSLEELLLQKEEIKRQKQAIKSEINSEINSRIQNLKSKPLKKQLSAHSFLVTTTKDPSMQSVVQAKVKQLLQFIVYGNQVEAEKMLINNPQILPTLLTQKAEVIDYSGRKILGTALQLAMGAKDVRYHDDEERMVEMLMRYYQKLPDGEAVIAAQIAEQFPEGCERQEIERHKRDILALNKVINAIEDSRSDKERDNAIEDFVGYLKLQTANTIISGYHFNDQLLLEALKLYDQNYERFGDWDSVNNTYCWRKVIGNIERYLTACDAQAFCQGIYNIVEDKKKLTRSLTCRWGDLVVSAVKFYPLDSDPRFCLGDDYAASLHATVETMKADTWGGDAESLEILLDKKHQRCEHLRSSINTNLRRVHAL